MGQAIRPHSVTSSTATLLAFILLKVCVGTPLPAGGLPVPSLNYLLKHKSESDCQDWAGL